MFNLIEVVPPGFRPPDIESQGTGRTQETSKKKQTHKGKGKKIGIRFEEEIAPPPRPFRRAEKK